jgi:hypothetical protein
VLDHNLGNFYSLFNELEDTLQQLKVEGLKINEKQLIDGNSLSIFIRFRREFYDIFLAIDERLYNNIKSKFDILQGFLSDIIYDEGINLSHAPKFDEIILDNLIANKTRIVEELYTHRFDVDN